MNDEKRMAKNYEIIEAVHIGDNEVVFGVDDKNEFDLKCLSVRYIPDSPQNAIATYLAVKRNGRKVIFPLGKQFFPDMG